MITKTLQALIWSRRKELPFIVFSSFLTTFLLSRLLLRFVLNSESIPVMFLYLTIGGQQVHVHHLVYGVIILTILSFVAICYPQVVKRFRHSSALALGFALGLIYDEFGIWLTLNPFYYAEITYNSIIVISSIFLLIVYAPPFFVWNKKRIKKRQQSKLPL